jgi:hypothetical protein
MTSLKDEAEGVVYFIGHGKTGPVKIGFTADLDPMPRLRQLQTGSPEQLKVLGIISAYASIERKIQSLLAPHNIRGEWFDREAAISVLRRLKNKESFHRSHFVDKLWSISIESIHQEDVREQLSRVNTEQPLPFRSWLITQSSRDHATGDLARDAIKDPEFPSVGSLADYLRYIKSVSYSPTAIRTTIEAWIECDLAIRRLATREQDEFLWPTT